MKFGQAVLGLTVGCVWSLSSHLRKATLLWPVSLKIKAHDFLNQITNAYLLYKNRIIDGIEI